MRVRALDGGHLGDVRQLRRGRLAWVASERQLRSVIGSGVELKEALLKRFFQEWNGKSELFDVQNWI